MKKVIVGMSGGVDSSVAAYLLKQQGYEVEALFMKNWSDTTGLVSSECSWEDDVFFAEMVSKKLEIPFHTVDLSNEYRSRVADYMFAEYEKGRTPNPDVLCNREIKFDSFLKEALNLGADYVATGHYCRKDEFIQNDKTIYRLLAGIDNNKDQSYFLCQLSQQQLEKAMFPIGHLQKPEVREIASQLKLPTAMRKDSQGICFIGKVDLPTFLQQKLTAKEGDIIEIPSNYYENITREESLQNFSTPYYYKYKDGFKVGKHKGAHFYTIGQRKGLNVGGKEKPVFVISTDIQHNIVYVGMGDEHQGLYRKGLFIRNDEIHWIRKDLKMNIGEQRHYQLRIRYRQPLQKATLHMEEAGLYVIFNEAQRGITPGQFAAWYDNEELIGSGTINE